MDGQTERSSTIEEGAPSAEELARMAQRGSLSAFAQLVRQFEPRLFNFIVGRIGNWSDAEELTQETFVRSWERIDRYDDRWRFSTWLFTIGLRLTVSHHRTHSRMKSGTGIMPEKVIATDHIDRISRNELAAPTWRLAAEVLSTAQHTALWLRYVEGLSIQEVAQVMERSDVSVRVMLFRARDALARHILASREEGYDLSEASAAAVASALAAAGGAGA